MKRRNISPVARKPTISSPPITYTPGPTLGQSIKDGFGFGLGSAIAHRIIGPAPVVVQHQQTPASSASPQHPPEYERCMKESFNDVELCKEYLTKAAPSKT
jgi:hypothetical protein